MAVTTSSSSVPSTAAATFDVDEHRRRIRLTCWYAAAFGCLGLVLASLGPVMLVLQEHTSSTLAQMGSVFVARSAGYLAGSVCGGVVFDRTTQGNKVLGVSMLGAGAATALVPFLRTRWLVGITVVAQGVAMGLLDTGGNVMLLWLWADSDRKVDPYMQGLHAAFGIGAFLSPIFIGALMEARDQDISLSFILVSLTFLPVGVALLLYPSPRRSEPAAVARPAAHETKRILGGGAASSSSDAAAFTPAADSQFTIELDDIALGDLDRDNDMGDDDDAAASAAAGRIAARAAAQGNEAYWRHVLSTEVNKQGEGNSDYWEHIARAEASKAAGLGGKPRPLVSAANDDDGGSDQDVANADGADAAAAAADDDDDDDDDDDGGALIRESRAYKWRRGQVVLLVSLFLCLYVGAEVTAGGYIYTYAVKLELAQSHAAYMLQASFWGAIALGRIVSIPLSLAVPPEALLGQNLVGCVVAIGLILLSLRDAAMLWVGVILYGLFMASCFPTAITLAESYTPCSGRIASLFVIGASLGEMVVPGVVAHLMENSGASYDALWYSLMLDQLACVVVVAALVVAGRSLKRIAGQT